MMPTALPSVAASPSPAASPSASPAQAAPSALAVDCTDTGTTAATDSVSIQADGVHFQVHSVATGRAFTVGDIAADNAPSPDGVLVFPLTPGTVQIWCGPTDPTDADWVTVHVVDPTGIYVPAELTCASGSHGTIDYVAGAHGVRGDLVANTRKHLRGLRPGDVVEAAGYRATQERKVRVTRGGEIILVATYTPDDYGGWLLGGTNICEGSGITWHD